jgi:hypothetical protein
MKVRYLLDENISPIVKTALLRLNSSIDVLRVGDAGCPPLGTPDPVILEYIEQSQRILVTSNRKSMPEHLESYRAGGGKLQGLFWVRSKTPIQALVRELF